MEWRVCGAESCSLALNTEIYTCCPGRATHQGGSVVVWFGLSLDSRSRHQSTTQEPFVSCCMSSASKCQLRKCFSVGRRRVAALHSFKTEIWAVLMRQTFNWWQKAASRQFCCHPRGSSNRHRSHYDVTAIYCNPAVLELSIKINKK